VPVSAPAPHAHGTDPEGPYYATASGTVFHRPGCAVVAHHAEDLRVLGPGSLGNLRPCQICLPGAG